MSNRLACRVRKELSVNGIVPRLEIVASILIFLLVLFFLTRGMPTLLRAWWYLHVNKNKPAPPDVKQYLLSTYENRF